MVPSALDGMTGEDVLRNLFGIAPSPNGWVELIRHDERSFTLTERRLGVELRTTHGFLVALHEVSNAASSAHFCQANRLSMLGGGGLHLRGAGVCEVPVRCRSVPFNELVEREDGLPMVRTSNGMEATVGLSSLLYRRLVVSPAAETDSDVPDPGVITTMVIRRVDATEVSRSAESALYHFRRELPGLGIEFASSENFGVLNVGDADEWETGMSLRRGDLPTFEDGAVVAFYNRAIEADPISGFLYFYRVIEAAFDVVLGATVSAWRRDASLEVRELMKNFRRLFQEGEDRSCLSAVFTVIVAQTDLERMSQKKLIDSASCAALVDAVYERRNMIAHGRIGQHSRVLVPYGFAAMDGKADDEAWYAEIKVLAGRVVEKWFLR